ncbi:MAG TPA: hypothetical protein VFF23_00155 [Hanamia sp.]|nr:hypothetical protein [Hanamia sp.]
METMILNENRDMQDAEIQRINSFCSRLNRIMPEFEAETNYRLNISEVATLLQRNDFDEVINSVNTFIAKGLKAIRVTETAKKTFTNGTASFVRSFANKLKEASESENLNFLDALSIEGGKIVLSKEAEQTIRLKFVDQITSAAGKEFYDLHLAAAKSLTDLSKFIKENTRLRYLFLPQMTGDLFNYDSQAGEIRPKEKVRYDALAGK